MSISSQLLRIQQNIASAYQAVSTMGGTLPATQDATHLPEAIATLADPIPSPEGYTLLSYIEADGKQRINTGITNGQPGGLEIGFNLNSFKPTSSAQQGRLIAWQITSPLHDAAMWQNLNTGDLYYDGVKLGSTSKTSTKIMNNDSNDHVVKLDGNNIYIDNTSVGQ